MTLAPSTAAAAWPRAQAFTSWAKSTTSPSCSLRSTSTREPQSLEIFSEEASGAGRRPARGMLAARVRILEE